jgi:hypothetical protein
MCCYFYCCSLGMMLLRNRTYFKTLSGVKQDNSLNICKDFFGYLLFAEIDNINHICVQLEISALRSN